MNSYQRGEWDMFERVTSVWYGKQCYFRQDDDDIVYSRNSHKYMKRDDAYDEFIKAIGW